MVPVLGQLDKLASPGGKDLPEDGKSGAVFSRVQGKGRAGAQSGKDRPAVNRRRTPLSGPTKTLAVFQLRNYYNYEDNSSQYSADIPDL